MFTTLSRIIKYGLQNFVRNPSLSIATTAVLTLTLILSNGLFIFNALSKQTVSSLQNKIDISVYFKDAAAEENILAVKKSLEDLNEVKSVDYVSRERAFEIFKEQFADDQSVKQALAELKSNPLPASLNIRANDPREYAGIAAYLENENLRELIDKVTYQQNRLIIDKLTKITEIAQAAGLAITLFLALIATLIIFNTIRLAIYSNRDELTIMRLVGAANRFINGPYLVTGLLYGIVAAVVSLIIFAPLVGFVEPYVNILLPEVGIAKYFYANIFTLLGIQFVIGAALGIISSLIALRKYLQV